MNRYFYINVKKTIETIRNERYDKYTFVRCGTLLNEFDVQ